MAHPLSWPGKYFFYPIGNTPAVSLTRDIPPEEPADIMLLGCGDPRNVLYTIFNEPSKSVRVLDFTCCDIDPAILARNIILFTMLIDDEYAPNDTLWDIFYHFMLDTQTHNRLIAHCQKLLTVSSTMEDWAKSSYGPFLKLCTLHTLFEVRRHWELYIAMKDLPRQKKKLIREVFSLKKAHPRHNEDEVVGTSARSAGPLMHEAVGISTSSFRNFWKNGVTYTDKKRVDAATLMNPTFVYSLGGEGCCLHYGTDPLTPFHTTHIFGNMKGTIGLAEVVKAARDTFNLWCLAYRLSLSSDSTRNKCSPVIRFIVGDALAVCRAFDRFSHTRNVQTGVPVAQWKGSLLTLDSAYVAGSAPTLFNVVDTSNLDDHLGAFNVLISAARLLSQVFDRSSVLYTESLIYRSQDATKEFTGRLYVDVTVMGVLLGLCPIDYLSGFTTRSNTHEVIMYKFLKKTPQYHQVMTWKRPASEISLYDSSASPSLITFDPHQLGALLYDIYHRMFEQEDSRTFERLNQSNILNAIMASNVIHHIRETFVVFLKLVKDRLNLTAEEWMETMDRFMSLQLEDQSMPMDSVNRHDFFQHMYLRGVYSLDEYRSIHHDRIAKVGVFERWIKVPPIVRVVLTVPREKLDVLLGEPNIGTPPLQCFVRGEWSSNIFASVHVVFGRAVRAGTAARPSVLFEEDVNGWQGTSDLIASFTMPSRLLAEIEPQKDLKVCFAVRSTTANTMQLVPKLGIEMALFRAQLLDSSQVIVIPEQPISQVTAQQSAAVVTGGIGQVKPFLVELDEEYELVSSLSCRVSVEDANAKYSFSTLRLSPALVQISSCAVQLTIGESAQVIIFPFPIRGFENRLRLARTSSYIEIIVPISGPFDPNLMQLRPFPVVKRASYLTPWNIHQLRFERMPTLDVKGKKLSDWLNPHLGSMMSARERSLRKKTADDPLTRVKDSLHAIMVQAAGVQHGAPKRLFALRDKPTNNIDTIFLIEDLRYDLPSYTVACNAFVLPLTHEIIDENENDFRRLVSQGDLVTVSTLDGEMKLWKHLIPALVERCRTWSHGVNCEYKSSGKIPLTDEMERTPICSCGRGKDVEGMKKVPLWRKFAPYATRIALSPLFGVSYLETVGKDPDAHRCSVCRKRGKPKLQVCTGCKKVKYCSKECQRKDWKRHERKCKLGPAMR